MIDENRTEIDDEHVKKDPRTDREKRQLKKGVLDDEEKLDESLDESFPASDPPANY